MLDWVFSFFMMAMVAAVLGFTNLTGPAVDMAKIPFFVFLILAIASFIFVRKTAVR